VRKFQVIGSDTRPAWWRSVPLVLFAGFGSLLSLVYSPASWAMQHQQAHLGTLVVMFGLLMTAGWSVALFWRHRLPFILTIASALASILIPLGNTVPFILLASLIGRRRGPAVRWTTALVSLTSTWVVVADALAQPRGASLLKATFIPPGADPSVADRASPYAVVLIVVMGLALTLGAGYLMRSLRETANAKDAVSEQRATSDRLGDEVARRQERERIAREVHDAMGHRLSVLNLHAGALEANAEDPRVAESAHLVRTSATAAMDDLRSLLSVLRDPMGSDLAELPLERLPEVLGDSFGAGQSMSSSIFIADADRADPVLSRAVYRIVQEMLTNARRHAPGEQVCLTVEGGPAKGIVIDCRNRYAGADKASEPGSSRGLTGITERAELLGGQMLYGLDEGGSTFRVHVELPWREA
jgi:signal transduction histidine kinase